MIKNLLNLFFPTVCLSCSVLLSDNEKHICTTCRHNLPVTNYHFNNDSTVEEIFYGRAKIEKATALFRFHKKGIVQQLLHNLKYRGFESVSSFLGSWLGEELSGIDHYKTVDMVIPVPLHKSKLKQRGYNQVAKFGEKIAALLEAKYKDDVLLKVTSTKTQVFKKRFARWSKSDQIFSLKTPEIIQGKHILLVDDIVTTGATIEACSNILLEVPNVKISVAVMAIAS